MRATRSLLTWFAAAVVGTFALTGCSVYDLPLPGGVNTGSNPMTVRVLFKDVLDLVPQTTVKVSDVTVGKVKSISLRKNGSDIPVAEVTIELPGNVNLPANEKASIRQTSLLGEKFVSLQAPEQPVSTRLKDGDTISLEATQDTSPPDVEDVFKALGALLSGGSVGQLRVISQELAKVSKGREGDIRSLITQMKGFMGQLSDNKVAIVNALTSLDLLARQLNAQRGIIEATLQQLPAGLAAIDKQRADLVKMLAALSRLSDVGVRVIEASRVSTISSINDLAPILGQLASAGDNFAKSFDLLLTYPFPNAVVGTTPAAAKSFEMGDYTNLSVNLDLKIDQLAGIPGIDLSQVCSALSAVIPNCTLSLPSAPPVVSLPGKTAAPAPAKPNAGALTPLVPKVNVPMPSLPLIQPSAPSGGTLNLNQLKLFRSKLNDAFLKPGAVDPLGLAKAGYDPGLTMMLLQGVQK